VIAKERDPNNNNLKEKKESSLSNVISLKLKAVHRIRTSSKIISESKGNHI